jgi:chromosome segregation ATPase
MTTAQPDRLDRIEALVEANARSIQALGNDIASFKGEVAEFKRVVAADHEQAQAERQALSRDVAQLVATQEQNSRELNQAMIRLADTQEGIARLLGSLDEDRPTILRKLNTIEGKVDNLLQRGGMSNHDISD